MMHALHAYFNSFKYEWLTYGTANELFKVMKRVPPGKRAAASH